MSDDPDELAAGLQELAEREAPAAGERFEAGLRQALRWEQRRRRNQSRWLLVGEWPSDCPVRRARRRPGAAGDRPLPAAAGRPASCAARRADQRPSGAALSPIGLLGGTEPRTGGAIGIRRQGLAGRPGGKAKGKSAGAYTPNVWSSGWAYVRPTASPNPGVASPAGVPTLAASPSPRSPSSTPTPTSMPTPTPTPTPTSP